MKTLYNFVGGRFNGAYLEKADVEAVGNGRYTEDLSALREAGRLVHREELDNQPLVDDYTSPMWDGLRYIKDGKMEYEFYLSDEEKESLEPIAILRYETYEVYERLSR